MQTPCDVDARDTADVVIVAAPPSPPEVLPNEGGIGDGGGSDGVLPDTGAPPGMLELLLLGLVLLAAGTAMVAASRRGHEGAATEREGPTDLSIFS